MEITRRPKLLALLAITLLIMVAVASVLSLVIRQKQKNEINSALTILQRNNLPMEKVEQTLGSLFNAEIEFREYTISFDKLHLEKYHNHINNLVANIDTLQQILVTFNSKGSGNAIATLNEREKQADSYLRLRRLSDSLLVVSSSFDTIAFTQMDDSFYLRNIKPSPGFLNIDTLDFSTTSGKRNKGVFEKIKTFFVGEDEQTTTNSKVVVKSGTSNETTQSEKNDSIQNLKPYASVVIDKTSRYYQFQLSKQFENRNKLRNQELKLINLNNSLLTEIRLILGTFKTITLETQSRQQLRSSKSIARSSGILQKTLLLVILISLPLSILTFLMLRKNQKYQAGILLARQEALHRAEEKSRFLSYMSHEFRTPLSSVIGFAEQIEQTQLNQEQKDYLSGLMSSSEMLLSTVNDILDLSKLDAGRMSFLSNPFRPNDAIQQVLKSFKKMARDKSIILTHKHEGKELTLLGDEFRLKQVLNNLVSNAIKYTSKGKVDITSRIVENGGDVSLKVEVTDTGIGIAPEKIGKIFDEYSRVHDETPEKWIIGTGLGLAVTKKLIIQMGGEITVSSKPGYGSVFAISIPFPSINIQQFSGQNLQQEPALPDRKISILVADDNFFSVMLLKSIFNQDNVTIGVAENGIEALAKLEAEQYDILLSDMYMPHMNGLELTRQIRSNSLESLCKLPVIMLTGNISPEACNEMDNAGVSDFLIKPFPRRDLIELVIKHLS